MTTPSDDELDDDLPPDLRELVRRIRELPDVEPSPGWEERALERWRRSQSPRRRASNRSRN